MKNLIIAIAATTLLAGCGLSDKALFFGQSQVVGIAIGTNSTGTTPAIEVGYKDGNIAHIPVIYEATDGSTTPLEGDVDVNQTDAYSTFGQFTVTAEATKASLGKFFATGIAARYISAGFACKVSDGEDGSCLLDEEAEE